jgi:predicted membrane-bound spermidine synthase
MKHARLIFVTSVLCLLLSGIAGLVYQVVWARYLALFLGHTSYAVVAVLVAFMGGLALGNVWFGKRADRTRRPLAVYAWLEIGIALYALLFPWYYELCHQAYLWLAKRAALGSGWLLGLKFLFSLATILIPTTLMGGTLPVLTRLVTRKLGELRERVAALYFINSAGAVLGCILADFWWIPSIGLQATVFAGAAMNLVVGAVALFVSGWIKEEQTVAPAVSQPAAAAAAVATDTGEAEERFSDAELRLAVIGIGLSGFVAMLYEIVWTRMLALALGSSTHAFSLMLITFITGIAVGAWVVYRWKRLRHTMAAFGWSEIALAATLAGSMWFYEYLPYCFVRLAGLLVRMPEAYPIYEFVQALVCFSVMLIPTICLGMTLPLVSRIATAELARTGRSVGAVFSVNTVGTVLGAAVTGLWILPWLGLARTLALGITLNALVGLVVLLRHQLPWRNGLLVGSPFLVFGAVVAAGWTFDTTWRQAFTLGMWRSASPPASLKEFRARMNDANLKHYRDGAGSTVSVHSWQQDGQEQLSLKVNGKADASTGGDVITQLLSGHIPMLLRPQSSDVLVIGLGSGMTCGAVLRHPTVERLDAVEISPEVAEGARFFASHNDNVLDNPRCHLVIEDAKSFLQLSDRRYDAIISEPSNPWMAGVSGVFSREYYQSCRRQLKDRGLMVQWVQLYETNDEAFDMILGTFTSVFPYLNVWQGSIGDLILVGSIEPLAVDFAALMQRFQHPPVRSDLERIEMARLPVFLSAHVISQQNAIFVPPPDVQTHSDYYPTLEYVAQKAFFSRREADRWIVFNENFSPRPTTLLAAFLARYRLSESDFKAFSRYYIAHQLPPPPVYLSLLARWQQHDPRATLPLELAARLIGRKVPAELEVERLGRVRDRLLELAPTDPELLRVYQKFLMHTYRSQRSAFWLPPADELRAVLERLIETDKTSARLYRLQLAELAWDRGDDAACLALGQAAFDPDTRAYGPIDFEADPVTPRWVLARMIESLWRAGKPTEAWELCQQAKQNRYVGEQSTRRDPILEATYRKVEAFQAAVQKTEVN